jgi:single-stranded-DNA-specific exonuclease
VTTLLEPPRWIVGPRDRAAEAALQNALGLPSLVTAVLAQRGLTDPEAAHHFLNPSLDDLHDPSGLPDYVVARDAIFAAKERGDLIFIHGDYDVDGVTSAAILYRFLSRIGCKVHVHVPHRMKEGYGIHLRAVEEAKTMGAKLFLTCDCGISAMDQVAAAREAGMTVVVTDHHTVGHELPNAHAIVNPHRSDSEYPFAELSGAGVAFKLCAGLTRDLGHPVHAYYRGFLDLAALGTIADVMPLVGENRIIARFGLERLADTKKVGIQSLMRAAQVTLRPGQPLRASDVGWRLGPRLNAAGRIDDAALALKLLLSAEAEEADAIAEEIEAVNVARKAEQSRVMEEAAARAESDGAHRRNVLVVAGEGWHSGIVGIVAGRLAERYRRPTFVLTVNPETGMAKGSARSIPNFNLADAIRAFPHLMDGGGHAMAAGCAFPAERLADVIDALDGYAGERLTPEDFRPTLQADLELEPEEVTFGAVESLSMMEPFGCENPEPSFVARKMPLSMARPTRNPAHAQVTFRRKGGMAIPGIAFGIGESLCAQPGGCELDVLFAPMVSEYRGMRELKWQVKAFTPSGSEEPLSDEGVAATTA